MAVIALLSGKGAPGVSTTALGLALHWHRPVLLVEADTAGGSVLAGYLRGACPADRGLLSLAIAQAHLRFLDPEALREQTITLPAPGQHDGHDGEGRVRLLAGLTDATQAGALHGVWGDLAGTLQGLDRGGVDVLVDVGRYGPGEVQRRVLLTRAEQVVLLTGSCLPQVHAAQSTAQRLRTELDAVSEDLGTLTIAVVGPGRPYEAQEIAQHCALPLAGTLPWDPAAAGVYSTGERPDRRFARGRLNAGLDELASTLRQRVAERAHRLLVAAGGAR